MNAFTVAIRSAAASYWARAVIPALATLLLAGVPVASAPAFASTLQLTLTVGGANPVDKSQSGSGISLASNYASNGVLAHLEGRAYRTGDLGVQAIVHGNVAATAKVTGTSPSIYMLTAPNGASVTGGKFVLRGALAGKISGNATLDFTLDVQFGDSSIHNSDTRTMAGQPGDESVTMDITVPFNATLDPGNPIVVSPTMTVNAVATIAASNTIGSASADALDSASLTGFRVLNAAGTQVTGFQLVGGGKSVPELAPAPAGEELAIEYYHSGFEHYFVTSNADEIRGLDDGTIAGWQRTGESFRVYALTASGAGRVPIYRFFSTAFGPKSSHFYVPPGPEFDAVKQNSKWVLEHEVFLMKVPDDNGACPMGTVPVYRLYNDGQGGAPNHRFTTSEDTRLDMLRDGYIAEGVAMCAPST